MANLRDILTKSGINWSNVVIVAHTVDKTLSPGWGRATESFMFDFRENTLPEGELAKELLDHEFDTSTGAPQIPRFIADDGAFLYFPEDDHGSTTILKVSKDIRYYMDITNETPYPGS